MSVTLVLSDFSIFVGPVGGQAPSEHEHHSR